MSDWDEIRRLAADFQRAQSAGASQKLSERNCIEIVMKLIELKLIDVIYTTDGKEYLTHNQLLKEVKDELYVSGGRISLVEIASALNVDFSHIEQTALQIAKSDRETHLVLGQLVSYHYLDNLARQINEILQQKGTISIPSLTKEYDLPTEFLVDEVSKRIGSIIQGFKDESDPKIIMTLNHIARNRAKVRGILSAITIPTPCASIISRFGLNEKLFFSLADELIRIKHIPGTISGGRNVAKATYIPHSYSRSQNSWIEDFYTSNSYIEYDSVSRLGISDPTVFLKKKFKNEKMVYLDTCVLGPALLDQIETAVSEALGAGSWIDLIPLLPSILSQEDEAQLVSSLVGGRSGTLVLGGTTLLSNKLVEDVKTGLEADMESRAKQDVESGLVQQCLVDNRGAKDLDEEKVDRKDERRKKAAGGKAGGGAQGRETKTKSTKKKGGKKKDDDWEDSDEEVEKKGGKGEKGGKKKELEYKSFAVLKQEISVLPNIQDCDEEIFGELAEYLQDGLDRRYKEVSKEVYQSTLAASLQSKKRTHSDLQEKVNNMFTTLRLNERAIQEFKVDEHKTALSKHLLKTLGSELVTEIFLYLAEDNMIKIEDCKELSVENRLKIMKELPSQVAEPAMKLHKTLLASSAEEFIHTLENELMNVCDVMLKKIDKKKDRQILFSHRHQLLDQLGACTDPALTLHLAALILFQHVTGSMVHASGKFVPSILALLQDKVGESDYSILSSHQTLVIQQLKEKQDDKHEELETSMAAVKAVVTALKKNSEEKEK